MSRLTVPLGLTDRLLGERHAPRLDEAAADRLERALRRLEPDPLFRRRLRGAVLNRYVAEREGLARRPAPRRAMGGLGRAVLYASLVLAIGMSAVGAAAQDALPGDGLYAVKLQIERVRMRVAPPALRDDLAALALAERIAELERLAAAEEWTRVSVAAAQVAAAEDLVVVLDPARSAAPSRAVTVLEAVLETAPPASKPGIQTAIQSVLPGAGDDGATEPAAPAGSSQSAGHGRPGAASPGSTAPPAAAPPGTDTGTGAAEQRDPPAGGERRGTPDDARAGAPAD